MNKRYKIIGYVIRGFAKSLINKEIFIEKLFSNGIKYQGINFCWLSPWKGEGKYFLWNKRDAEVMIRSLKDDNKLYCIEMIPITSFKMIYKI